MQLFQKYFRHKILIDWLIIQRPMPAERPIGLHQNCLPLIKIHSIVEAQVMEAKWIDAGFVLRFLKLMRREGPWKRAFPLTGSYKRIYLNTLDETQPTRQQNYESCIFKK